ncbi:MAG TPA: hypothetical protein VKS79_23680 [Gemmataceae bacterium]|nr:hypothetical protein [Gemmataceae bacterium]
MLDRSQLALAVGHADVVAGMAFHSAARYFHDSEIEREYWKADVQTLGDVSTPLQLSQRAFVIVNGDILANITASDSCTLIIYGNVRAAIETHAHSEIVVAGDVCRDGGIYGNDITHLFVGGDANGILWGSSSFTIWTQGHLRGDAWTGNPIMQLWILGDCSGKIRPIKDPALLYMEVGGYMPYDLLKAIGSFGYTEFNASIGTSDRPAGLYPSKGAYNYLQRPRNSKRWVIRTSRNQVQFAEKKPE